MRTNEKHSDSRLTPASSEEERLNHGVITVLEQTKETDVHDVGDRHVMLGRQGVLHKLVNKGTEDQGFVPQAVPLAHIELPQLLEEDELNDWLNTDVGKLTVAPFFEEMDGPEILTDWAKERDVDV